MKEVQEMSAAQAGAACDPMTQWHTRSGSWVCCRAQVCKLQWCAWHGESLTVRVCRIKGTVSPQGALLAGCCYQESSGFPPLLLSGNTQLIKHRLLLQNHSLHLPGAAGILWPLFCSPALMAVIVTHLHFRCCYQAVILL